MDMVLREVYNVVTNSFASVDITITPPSSEPFVIRGIPVRITQQIVEHEGSYVNAPFSHVSVMESDLTDNGASPRKTNNLASMKGWLVEWTDAIRTWQYKVSETQPDSTVGRISLILEDV